MIYISTSLDPFVNLAIEHHLFETSQIPALLLYQNHNCVIIGRAQNPWIECAMHFLEVQSIPLVRRQSGGGTVFHDLGNLNFTFFAEKEDYDKSKNLLSIMLALNTLGLNIQMNERHDLLLHNKKISGSAFRETRDRAFHHATLLINSDLALLRQALKVPALNIQSKGVASVKSSVTSLAEALPGITPHAVIEIICQYFRTQGIKEIKQIDSAPAHLIAMYQSDAWRFEKTLPFSHTLHDNSVIFVEAGVIIDIKTTQPDLKKWLNKAYADFFRSGAFKFNLCK